MKYKIKAFITVICMLFTLPLSVPSLLLYNLFGSERLFAGSAQLLSLIPGLTGQYIRTSFYKITLSKCHYDLAVNFGSFFAHPTARVGRRVVVSVYSIIGTATIDDDVLISARVSLLSGKYQHSDEISTDAKTTDIDTNTTKSKRITIGKNCWIGENAIIMDSIGNNCTVSAGSVVTKPMPDNMTAIGNPARFLKKEASKSDS